MLAVAKLAKERNPGIISWRINTQSVVGIRQGSFDNEGERVEVEEEPFGRENIGCCKLKLGEPLRNREVTERFQGTQTCS